MAFEQGIRTDAIYVSDRFYDTLSTQSLDCDEIAIQSGNAVWLLSSNLSQNEGFIDIRTAKEVD